MLCMSQQQQHLTPSWAAPLLLPLVQVQEQAQEQEQVQVQQQDQWEALEMQQRP